MTYSTAPITALPPKLSRPGQAWPASMQVPPDAPRFVVLLQTAPSANAPSFGPAPRALTARELDVLRLIAKGYQAPEVAAVLGLSAHTVRGYVRDVYRKLGISSRAEATLEALQRGLVR